MVLDDLRECLEAVIAPDERQTILRELGVVEMEKEELRSQIEIGGRKDKL
jgi:hypothetical protein